MGQDYSYSQPSSSEASLTWLLEEEAALYADQGGLYGDEAESAYNIAYPVQLPRQPEVEDGIPTLCYCGGEAIVETSGTKKHPGRLYFTCENAADGECHVWKWWDVGVMEEMSDIQRMIRQLKTQCNESEEKVVKLETIMSELCKKKSGGTTRFKKLVCLMGCVILVLGLLMMLLPGKFYVVV